MMPAWLNAQVTISVQLPPAGLITKDQLWNVVLANNNKDMIEISLLLDLQDAVTGQSMLSAASGSLLLSKGVKVISSTDLQPIQYNYSSSDFMGSYLPMGSYIACYRASRITEKGQEPLADECLRLNISPLSPPLLNTPLDKSVSETTYPQFSWMPPTPLQLFSNLSYDLLLTEVLEGQSPTEAILYNNPVYTSNNVKNTFESYPSFDAKLDTGKVYAWQITARNGLSYAAQTEVWTFSLAGQRPTDHLVKSSPFIKMKMENPDAGMAVNGFLKLAYTNRYADASITVAITDMQAAQKEKAGSFTIDAKAGDNYIQYDLKKIIKYKENNMYEARIINSKGEKWVMLFTVVLLKDETN